MSLNAMMLHKAVQCETKYCKDVSHPVTGTVSVRLKLNIYVPECIENQQAVCGFYLSLFSCFANYFISFFPLLCAFFWKVSD